MGFRSPSAHQGPEIHSPRVSQARYVPPSGFGYPLDGLLPPSPCRPCFMPAALMGFAPSELSPPARYPGRFRPRRTRLPFLRPVYPPHEAAGPARTAAASGLCPSQESLAADRACARPTAGCSLGVRPSQGFQVSSLERRPAALLPRASNPPPWRHSPAPRSLDRLPPGSARTPADAGQGGAALSGFSCRRPDRASARLRCQSFELTGRRPAAQATSARALALPGSIGEAPSVGDTHVAPEQIPRFPGKANAILRFKGY